MIVECAESEFNPCDCKEGPESPKKASCTRILRDEVGRRGEK